MGNCCANNITWVAAGDASTRRAPNNLLVLLEVHHFHLQTQKLRAQQHPVTDRTRITPRPVSSKEMESAEPVAIHASKLDPKIAQNALAFCRRVLPIELAHTAIFFPGDRSA